MKKKKRQTGISASTPAAIICPKSTENLDTKASRPTGNVLACGGGVQHQGEQQFAPGRREHEAERRRDAGEGQRAARSAAAPGSGLAPSIIAASSSSLGMASKNALHQEHREGHVEGRVDDDQPGQAVGQPERRQDAEDRRHDHHQREHLRDQQQGRSTHSLPRKAKREKA